MAQARQRTTIPADRHVFTSMDYRHQTRTIELYGQLLARLDDTIPLAIVREDKATYAVIYGLEVKRYTHLGEAVRQFGYNVQHNINCEFGLE